MVPTGGTWPFDSDSGAQEVVAREVGENESVAIEVCHRFGTAQSANKDDGDNPVIVFSRSLSETEHIEPNGTLFHGYYFRLLKPKTGDNAVLGYPAEDCASGVMTFVVNKDTVYVRDTGPKTVAIAQKLQSKPSGKWNRVQ